MRHVKLDYAWNSISARICAGGVSYMYQTNGLTPPPPPFPEITNSHIYEKSILLIFLFPYRGKNQAMMGKDVN